MSHQNASVRPAEHYTVMLILVISMVTTFLMGMLITETLWGQGLDYFGSLRKQTGVSKSLAAGSLAPNKQIRGTVSIPEPAIPPAQPVLDSYHRVYQWGILLYWSDVTGEDYYQIERMNTDELDGWKAIGTHPACNPDDSDPSDCSAALLEHVDESAEVLWPDYPAYTYDYRVVAVNKYGSSISNVITVVPFYDSIAPDTPKNFRVVSQECKVYNGAYRTLTTLGWDRVLGDNPEKGSVGGTWYKLYRSNSASGLGNQEGGTANEVTEYTDFTSSSSKTQYYYRWIVNVDQNGNESVSSPRVKVEVKPCPAL